MLKRLTEHVQCWNWSEKGCIFISDHVRNSLLEYSGFAISVSQALHANCNVYTSSNWMCVVINVFVYFHEASPPNPSSLNGTGRWNHKGEITKGGGGGTELTGSRCFQQDTPFHYLEEKAVALFRFPINFVLQTSCNVKSCPSHKFEWGWMNFEARGCMECATHRQPELIIESQGWGKTPSVMAYFFQH